MSRALPIDSEDLRRVIPKESISCPYMEPSPLGGAGGGHPVGNLTPDPTTGLSHLRSPYRWKSLWNENTGGTGLRYIRYYNEFVGTEFDNSGPEPIDAFGPNGDFQDSDFGNTFYDHCRYNNNPFLAQYYDEFNPPSEPYFNGCFGDPNIYFPARPSTNLMFLSGKKQENEFSIWPNPATGIVVVQLIAETKGSTIKVFEVSGKEVEIQVESKGNGYWQFDTARLPSGVYEVKLTSDVAGVRSIKLVVIH